MRAYRLHLGEEAQLYRLAYNGDVVAFKMGRRQGKRVGGSAYRRIRRRVFATCGTVYTNDLTLTETKAFESEVLIEEGK